MDSPYGKVNVGLPENCRTCVHCEVFDFEDPELDYCNRFRGQCDDAIAGCGFLEWKPDEEDPGFIGEDGECFSGQLLWCGLSVGFLMAFFLAWIFGILKGT